MKKKRTTPQDQRRKIDHSRGRTRLLHLPILALTLTLIVEGFNRGSFSKLLTYVTTHPGFFLYNVLIVLTSLTFSELFKRRKAVLYITSLVWIAMGVGQFMVIKERTQPFTSMDLLMLKDAVTLTTMYYTWPQIIAICALIFLAVFAIIWMFTKLPKRRQVNYTLSLSLFCGLLTLCFCLCTLGVSFGYYPRYFENLVDAYNQYGFATCFAFTFGDMGVNKPDEYSTETVEEIIEDIDGTELPEPTAEPGPHIFDESDNLSQPNIIYVQLESLFDVNTILGSRYSKDPTPNFNRLSREFPSGELYVPSIGGGTANVEFEVLSGFNLEFFGAGEYPYSTVLQEATCETIAYNLLDQNYATTAMHNHNGKFYSRNEVYSRLGFEKFVSLEYMPYATYTDIGWCEDNILTREILKAMDATEQRDFVMAITVESHGKYDEAYVPGEDDPAILSLPEQINQPKFAHYLSLIHATDKFIGELIGELELYDEPVVCVFYGDHLPALDLTNDIMTTGSIYASRYVIWNNFGAEFEAPNLQAYRLSANLLKQLGMTGGVITKYHQAAEITPDEEYLAKLEMLEYDLLYGDQSSYENGENPYLPTNLQMGSVPVEIEMVSTRYGRVLITGKNFTEYSTILIDDVPYPTAFVSSSQVVALIDRETPVGEVAVAQITSDGIELGRTEPFPVEAP